MRRFLHLSFAAGSLLLASVMVTAALAQSGAPLCAQFGSTVLGKYIVQNNRWGSSAEQCIRVTSKGFEIVSQRGSASTSGAPLSYPSIFDGCHYGNCSPGTKLPVPMARIRSATSTIRYKYASGVYNASFDVWLDPTPKKTGVSAMEIMIWFNRQGPIQPIGARRGTANVGGRAWEVWTGSNGANNVVSYVAPAPLAAWSFSLLDFFEDVRRRSAVTDAWYLTSIQAGFEPWSGGVGLAVEDFGTNITTD